MVSVATCCGDPPLSAGLNTSYTPSPTALTWSARLSGMDVLHRGGVSVLYRRMTERLP